MIKFVLLSILVASCSTERKTPMHGPLSWKGRSSGALVGHPYFKNLTKKMKTNADGTLTWLFLDQSRFQTSAYCDSLGGCLEQPSFNCLYAFRIKHEEVVSLERSGSCPDDEVIEFGSK